MKIILMNILISIGFTQILNADCCKDNYNDCRAGDGQACYNLGLISEYNKQKKPDYKQAATLYKIAMDKGYADGYIRLGILHLKGLGVKKDIDKAKDLFATACNLGSENGCYNFDVIQRQTLNDCSYLR